MRLLPLLFLPSRRKPSHFEGLKKLDAEAANEIAAPESAVDELAVPEEAILAAHEAARAGLGKHKGLTNGSGAQTPRIAKSAGPPPRRRYVFGRSARTGQREGPGFAPATGLTNGAGLVNGDGRVNGSGRVNGGRINGGRVNGSRRVNGGLVNGGGLLYTEHIRERRRRSTRRTAFLLSLLMFGVAFLGPFLFYGLFAPPPIVIDGDFADWAGVPVVPDSPDDQAADQDINLVAFAALQGERDLYFYIQVAQQGRPFLGAQTPPAAESFRLLIDRDRNQSTGYLAYGLGIDYMVELTGYDGGLHASSLRVFPASSADATSVSFFSTAGAVRAIARGNQIEGSVPLLSLGAGPTSGLPYLLLFAQDSAGREDLGDAIFSSRPGVLTLTQAPTALGTIPTDRDSLLLTVEGRALHQNITLDALVFSVDGEGGGGVLLSYATFGGRNQTLNATASAGERVRVNFTAGGPLNFNVFSPPTSIAIFGRATGAPGVSALRIAVNGSQFALAGAPLAGTSGHASIFPPLSFERAYAGAAPPAIRIDGAFADWGPVRPFDGDPDDDVLSGSITPTPNATNAPPFIDQNIDIRESRGEVNSGAAQVSFLVTVDGSIMAGRLLEPPSYPQPTAPGGGAGGGAPGAPSSESDVASVYIDTDSSALTGWTALPGLGVDAILQVQGRGGGYGRTPRTTETSLALWDASGQKFNMSVQAVPVGYGSSKLETQVASSLLCPALCGRVRYAFFMQDVAGSLDATDSHSGSFRGDGEALLFDEGRAATRNAYQGDANVPVLSFAVASPASNQHAATLRSFLARLDGVAPADIPRVAVFADPTSPGTLEAAELAAGPLATGVLDANGFAALAVSGNLTLLPGDRLDALLCVDVSLSAAVPSWLNASIARAAGLQSVGVVDVRYSYPLLPSPVRILPFTPGFRGQNNLTINELNFVTGWIEFYDTTGSSTSLTSPAQMGFEIYRTNLNGGKKTRVAIVDLAGSTNSAGFATLDFTLGYSPSTQIYHIALWCSNCTAGQGANGKNNKTYIDDVIIPQNTTVGAWGRYPDGSGSFVNTTNNTRGSENAIPEFSGLLYPAGGTVLVVAAARRLRPATGNRVFDGRRFGGPP